ncbi:hypothetical protein B0I35DRAFT_476325 [Stachybotrys elegans]|uniref:VOC domain-containing protein n=1 Tax=Stachybotrys elegans TaxID=80388 RepID=A0A8K0SY77_9HYPO|nr:hypothetical protein B0I35DRAFT_476325 [Stachybotrys elegans]
MVVPFIDVSNLPASSSFYSAVLQPLGLSYLAPATSGLVSTTVDRDPPPSAAFGHHRTEALHLRQTPNPLEPLRLSSLVLTAPSRAAVTGFHACALRANPWPLSGPKTGPWLGTDSGVCRAIAYDLDGNKMEVVYPDPRSAKDDVQYTGSSVRTTQSTREEVGRILDWNYDVASARPRTTFPCSNPESYERPFTSSLHSRPDPDFYGMSVNPFASSAHSKPEMSSRALEHHYQPSYAPPRRSLTHREPSSRPYAPVPPTTASAAQPSAAAQRDPPPVSASPRQSSTSSGLNTTTVVGAILGVAAGAAVTYGLVSRDRDRRPRQEVEVPPVLPRRATFPEKFERYEKYEKYEPDRRSVRSIHEDRKSNYDDRRSSHDDYPPRSNKHFYADVVDDYADVWPPQRYLTEGSHHTARSVHSSHSASKPPPARSRATMDDAFDARSRHSSRYNPARAPSVRSRSETPIERSPYVAVDVDNRSQAHSHSRRSVVPKAPSSHSRSQKPSYDTEQDTYVSARTHKTSGTVRPPATQPAFIYPPAARAPIAYNAVARPPVPEPEIYDAEDEYVVRSRAGNKHTTTRFTVSGGQVTMHPASRAQSQISARHIPLPASGVGSSDANWDDDMESVVPDDSISCVGSKPSRRSRRRHHRD